MRLMKCASLMSKDGSIDLSLVTFPKLVSPKIDGNRCYIEDGVAKSSSGKPIRNNFIREKLSNPLYNGFDGELVVGSSIAKDVRLVTHSGVSAFRGEPDFYFYVFDDFSNLSGFALRIEGLHCRRPETKRIRLLTQTRISSLPELLAYETEILSQGYEGVIIRSPDAPYKQGRSTIKENGALKLKRFMDGEAIVVGVTMRYHNGNVATLSEHGYTERSSHKANKVEAGDMGALECRDMETGVEFNVGTGFSADDRKKLYENPPIGRIFTYKHFPVGKKDKPNLPTFVSWRDKDDLS